MKNALLIVLDGLGDRPTPTFKWKTALEYARTPNLDYLTKKAACGMMYSIGVGIRPSSDVAHMSLFGLDYRKYYTGRGPLELTGLGIEMQSGDLAWRGNFCTFDKDGNISDRRIQRNTPPRKLLDKLKSITIDGITFELYSVAEHRFALRAHGKNLSPNISDSDPHREGVPALKVSPITVTDIDSIQTAEIVCKYINTVREICLNDGDASRMGINGILLRGVGVKPQWPSLGRYGFETTCCIANNALYNGIAKNLGMKLKSITHYNNYLDYYNIIPQLVVDELTRNDFVFLHIQEGDLFGEDGNFVGKKNALEQIDKALSFVKGIDLSQTLVVLTADHSTPCALASHSGDAVPLVIAGTCVRCDDVKKIGERSCSHGSLGTILGIDLMNLILNYLGKAPLIGG